MSRWLAPGDYLPHHAPMLLLDEVVCINDEMAHCQVRVSDHGVLAPFLNTDGTLPGWYALELMAQTIGVWSGWQRLHSGQQSMALGMVLGARELVCAAGVLPAGALLDIEVKLLMRDERFSSFDCLLSIDGAPQASGRVNTFQPGRDELQSLFNQGTPS